jgi:hypothetical protein
MIRPVIVRISSVLFGFRISKMETQERGQNLPVPSPRTLLALPTRLPPDLNGSLGGYRASRPSEYATTARAIAE